MLRFAGLLICLYAPIFDGLYSITFARDSRVSSRLRVSILWVLASIEWKRVIVITREYGTHYHWWVLVITREYSLSLTSTRYSRVLGTLLTISTVNLKLLPFKSCARISYLTRSTCNLRRFHLLSPRAPTSLGYALAVFILIILLCLLNATYHIWTGTGKHPFMSKI